MLLNCWLQVRVNVRRSWKTTAGYSYLNNAISVHKTANPYPERDIYQWNTPLVMQFFYILWIIFLEDWCPSPFYCRTLSSVAFSKGRISVKWWWVTNVVYWINFLQLYFFTAEYERIIKYIHNSIIWNAICLNCVKRIIVLKAFQKYCFIDKTFCDVYREDGYIETLLELLKLSENSLVLSISTKTFQQGQQKHHSESVQQHIVIEIPPIETRFMLHYWAWS